MLGNSLRDQRSRYLELLVFLFELLVFVRVTVGELVDLDPVLVYLLPQLDEQHTGSEEGRHFLCLI